MPSDCRVALSNAPDLDQARRMARTLVEEGLAACVNLVPGMRSVYRWEGEVHDDPEVLLVIKTTAAAAGAMTRRLLELHPYQVPELVLLPVEGGAEAYLAWVGEQCRNNDE